MASEMVGEVMEAFEAQAIDALASPSNDAR